MEICRIKVHGKYKYYARDNIGTYYISEYSKKKKKYEFFETIVEQKRRDQAELMNTHKLLEEFNGNSIVLSEQV